MNSLLVGRSLYIPEKVEMKTVPVYIVRESLLGSIEWFSCCIVVLV